MRFSPWRLGPLAALSILAFGGAFAACTTPAPVVVRPCDDPGKVQLRGMDTGFEFCTGGPVHRAHIVSCPLFEPPPGECNVSGGAFEECQSNAECAPGGAQACRQLEQSKLCRCLPTCTSDLDCESMAICECGDPLSSCRKASCRSDADCIAGQLCIATTLENCGGRGFACTSALDECETDADCPGTQSCILESDHRICDGACPPS